MPGNAISHNKKKIISQPQTVVYPYAIVYDFEAYLDKTKRYKPTTAVKYENTHVAISVSVGETMNSQRLIFVMSTRKL